MIIVIASFLTQKLKEGCTGILQPTNTPILYTHFDVAL